MMPGIGADAIHEKGWIRAHQWLLLRRASQLGLLALFLAGPWLGVWIVKGNLNSSLTLGVLPLTDPYVLLQTLAAGHLPERAALTGAAIVLIAYFLLGGRAYCAWVCPVNLVTDAAQVLRKRLGVRGGARMSPQARFWILGMTLLLSVVTGTVAWELMNPVSMLHRGIIFGMGAAWFIVAAVFLLDLVIAERAWCGHLCPAGAFYSLLGTWSPLRISALRRAQCNDCADCYAVCPEPLVIKPALKGAREGAGPVILSPQCTNCGRCIDVCSKDVFVFGARFNNRSEAQPAKPHTAAGHSA
jgi:ferredoxin-type protein NapH